MAQIIYLVIEKSTDPPYFSGGIPCAGCVCARIILITPETNVSGQKIKYLIEMQFDASVSLRHSREIRYDEVRQPMLMVQTSRRARISFRIFSLFFSFSRLGTRVRCRKSLNVRISSKSVKIRTSEAPTVRLSDFPTLSNFPP